MEKIKNFIKKIDKEILFMSLITTFMIVYYINPLENVTLDTWNRSFCQAILSGISIDRRISNFYMLFLVQIPIIFTIITCIYGLILNYRNNYKKAFLELNIISMFPTLTAYISRYSTQSNVINQNVLLQTVLSFFAVLGIIAILDKDGKFTKKHISILCGAYLVGIITISVMLKIQTLKYVIIGISIIFLAYAIFSLKIKLGQKYFNKFFNYIYFLGWIPTILYIVREILFVLNERGILLKNFLYILYGCIGLYALLSFIYIMSRKKEIDFSTFGCIGLILSLCFMGCFAHNYQYVFSYNSYNDLYELSNKTVAADTILNGKLPIIDYFSAHALQDVWTKILYAFIHSDVKGILIDPYGGLHWLIPTIALFFILKTFFDKETSLLIICLFPFSILGIKAICMSLLSVLFLLKIIKNKTIKNYLAFWLIVLVSAFILYDEGISLGLACILTFIIANVIKKDWKTIKKFIITGICVGAIALFMYNSYCLMTGIAPISRIKEWIILSLNSSSTWATTSFGEPSSFAFLLSYFVVPIVTTIILVISIILYIREKNAINEFAMTITFAIAQLIYIPRTIIFHNLIVCSGITGVLLNFTHWTISSFVLYKVTLKKVKTEMKLFYFTLTIALVIICESVMVTNQSLAGGTLYDGAWVNSQTIDLSNDITKIYGAERCVYDEATTEFIKSFSDIFDVLLEEDETFLDFANITSLYMLTNRQRPFYVSQSPSLLTDIKSQELFLGELEKHKEPLAIMGVNNIPSIQIMFDVPHNVRYYKVAEHIYNKYRPLVRMGNFAIWCEKESYNKFKDILEEKGFFDSGYELIDYGYDFATEIVDENGNLEYAYNLYHNCDLKKIPYIWANYDEYNAISNKKIGNAKVNEFNVYQFGGSQSLNKENGNYVLIECNNSIEDSQDIRIVFYDSRNDKACFSYVFEVASGNNKYLIRASQDSFWNAFNIDSIRFENTNNIVINNVSILEGD